MGKLTITDIARLAGVSKATVSRVLNNRAEGVGAQKRAQILKLVEETGFQPCSTARCLATGESRSIGLVIPDITNPFYPLLVRGAERRLNECGYSLFLCNTDRSLATEEAYVRVLIEKRVDGVILDSAGSMHDAHVRLLEDNGIPIVLLDRAIGHRTSRYGVFVDNQRGAFEAAAHLLRRDDCRLLFLNGPAELSQSIERRAGVEEAARLAGATDRLRVLEGDFSVDSGFRLVAGALAETQTAAKSTPAAFNAVFAANDVMAIGALRALKQCGIPVPQEVEVMGFDDIELAGMVDPPLSTVSQPTLEMGTASADLLLRLIGGEKPRRKAVIMVPQLVLRGTTRSVAVGGAGDLGSKRSAGQVAEPVTQRQSAVGTIR